MLQKLRRNPDAVALVILCLLLGVARFSAGEVVAAHLRTGIGLRQVWAAPSPALDDLRLKLEDLRSRAEGPPCVPRLNF